MQGKKKYEEKLFTGFQLSERVPRKNIYRQLCKIPDLNFICKETKKYYGIEGRQSIDPVVFFKLILMGYHFGQYKNTREGFIYNTEKDQWKGQKALCNYFRFCFLNNKTLLAKIWE